MYIKYSKNVGNGSYLSTEFTVIACRSPYAVFLGRHSAREIHSIALDETHDENVASVGSQKKEFPCKILQVIAFLQGSCKILARNAFFLNQGCYICGSKS